ncbi:MAG: FGGY-family carbohydrate kinase [Gammaproteobacteria bacterium]|nr:FGGY-family carbohydrate kinase [Gammaproteobacteria bacterium]
MSVAETCFIGIDLGTSGCRTIAIDPGGAVIASSRAAMPESLRSADGGSEQQPEDWWQAASTTLADVIGQTDARVKAICVDGTSSSLLLCDADGRPCSPALMYDDQRAKDEAAIIERHAPAGSAARGASSALAKLMFLLRTPHSAGRARHAVHQADWIASRLTGRFGVSDENNALKLGYDPQQRKWPQWFEPLAVPASLLPRVSVVGDVLGTVSGQTAERFGLEPDTLVVAGTTDSNAAFLAAGATHCGEAVTSLGSTLVLKVLGERPVNAATYGVYSHRIGERWLIGGASNTGGSVLRRFFSDTELVALSAQIDPTTDSGLDYYPLPATGERFPIADPTLPARLAPRPTDKVRFLQGILEGIARIEAVGYRCLAELGAPYPVRVLSCGGGAANENWLRLRQRLLGVPVERATHDEAAYGSALLARQALVRREPTPS